MAIDRHLQKSKFTKEEARILTAAYDEIIACLSLSRVPAALGDALARKVIAVSQNCRTDRALIVDRVLAEIGIAVSRHDGPTHVDVDFARSGG